MVLISIGNFAEPVDQPPNTHSGLPVALLNLLNFLLLPPAT